MRFLHLVPNWQKSAWINSVLSSLMSRITSGVHHIRLVDGFSSTHGMPRRCAHLMNRSVASRHLLPYSTLLCSFSGRSGSPHSMDLLRITIVRSRAIEKLQQGGANINPRMSPCRMSRQILRCTGKRVRSESGP